MPGSSPTFKKTLTELEAENDRAEFDFFQQTEKTKTVVSPEPENIRTEAEQDDDVTEEEIPAEIPQIDTDYEEDKWINQSYDGKLAVDVYQTDEHIVIKSTIAGCGADDIDISINNEVITIKGTRRNEDTIPEENFFYRECYWGGFSRSIILPVEVDPSGCEASISNGILTIRLPKVEAQKPKRIVVRALDKRKEFIDEEI